MARHVRDLGDGAVERLLVRFRGLGGAADLADVLEGGGLHLLVGGGGLEVVEGVDVAAHAMRVRPRSDLRESRGHPPFTGASHGSTTVAA